MRVKVALGRGVLVAVKVAVGVNVAVGVRVAVAVGVSVGVAVGRSNVGVMVEEGSGLGSIATVGKGWAGPLHAPRRSTHTRIRLPDKRCIAGPFSYRYNSQTSLYRVQFPKACVIVQDTSSSHPLSDSHNHRHTRLYRLRHRSLAAVLAGLLLLAGCQSAPAALPTLAVLPTDAPATQSPLISPTATSTPVPTATSAAPDIVIVATADEITPTPSPTAPTVILIGTAIITTPTADLPSATPTLLPEAFQFGQSALGTPLTAYRYGTGSRIILLVGGVHTGFETNTVQLMRELQDHYTRNPNGVFSQISLVMIPVLNVDGLTYGEQLRGRFNANEVDLNRNWACGWSADAVFKDQAVNAGRAAFSEPETMALGALIQQIRPSVVIFYHAAARGVFPGNCGGFVSDPLAAVYSAASGYPYSSEFSDYTVTGSASGWVDSQGIPSVDVELATTTDTEILENLRALDAVQNWLAARP